MEHRDVRLFWTTETRIHVSHYGRSAVISCTRYKMTSGIRQIHEGFAFRFIVNDHREWAHYQYVYACEFRIIYLRCFRLWVRWSVVIVIFPDNYLLCNIVEAMGELYRQTDWNCNCWYLQNQRLNREWIILSKTAVR